MRIGAYEVMSELGRGATAIVYAARGPEGQPVAVKLLAAVGPIGRVTARFQREVEALPRAEPIGETVAASSATVPHGAEFAPGLKEALKAR